MRAPYALLGEFSDSREEPDGPANVAWPDVVEIRRAHRVYHAALSALADAWASRDFSRFAMSSWCLVGFGHPCGPPASPEARCARTSSASLAARSQATPALCGVRFALTAAGRMALDPAPRFEITQAGRAALAEQDAPSVALGEDDPSDEVPAIALGYSEESADD